MPDFYPEGKTSVSPKSQKAILDTIREYTLEMEERRISSSANPDDQLLKPPQDDNVVIVP